MMVSFPCPFCPNHDVEADMSDETYEYDAMISVGSIASDASRNCPAIKAVEKNGGTFAQWNALERAAHVALSEIG